ncbi:MFS transporter, partial [Streptomyces sp. TRM76130]|nr:MFS transporter [Streptomyces sp. TRM76130]
APVPSPSSVPSRSGGPGPSSQPDGRDGPPGPGRPAPGGGLALVAALLGFTVITIDVSAVNIALPAVQDSLSGGMAG